jgi:PAS domain S-box-containing protein
MNDDRQSLIQYYEQLPVAVYLCDRNDMLIAYNNAAASLFDISPLVGSQDWYPAIQKFDQDGNRIDATNMPVTREIRVNSNKALHEVRFRMVNGTDRFLLVSSAGIRDKFGNYEGAIHTISDVTSQRSSERQQQLLAAIVDSSEDAIIAKDLQGKITSWNRGAEQIFGYTAAEAIGKDIALIIPDDRIAEEKQIISAIKAGKKVKHFETIRRSKAGLAIPVSLTISPVRDLEGRIVGASKIARDITTQKKAEEQIKAYTSHLEEMVAKRTAELDEALQTEKELGQLKSRFVSMASHEFRTPLSSIKLSSALIEKYALPYTDVHIAKHTGKIKSAVNELSAILGDFLSLEKLESGKIVVSLSIFDLRDFCSETANEMQLLAKPGQQVIYEHSGLSDTVELDQHLLKNCLNNLLSNAIKYSGENTTIFMQTKINISKCILSVTDHGIGIPEADKPHLFSAFFRAGNTGTIQGTGLGLNIVARYADLMHGDVQFESHPDCGTTFTLRLPLNRN